MTPRRIGVITAGLPGPGRKPCGADVVAHRLATGLAERGHDVRVWSRDLPPTGAPYQGERIPAADFASTWLGQRLTMGYLANLFHLLPNYGNREILLAHGDSLLMPLLSRPVVRVMLGSGLGEALTAKSLPRVVLQLGVYLQEMATTVLQPSVAISRATVRHLPMIRHIIPIGVDTRAFTPGGDRARVPTVLFVGTLGGRKRGQTLIDWFHEHVRPVLPDAVLHAVVEKPGPPTPGVAYHVGIDHDTLLSLYRQAWVYASPSQYEGLGLPYLEAMACGTPVLACPNPGSLEVLDGGRCGALAEDANFPQQLLALLQDETLRQDYATRGLAQADRWSLERTLDQYEALIERTCSHGVTAR